MAALAIAAIATLFVLGLMAWTVLSFASAWRAADQLAACGAVCVDHLLED